MLCDADDPTYRWTRKSDGQTGSRINVGRHFDPAVSLAFAVRRDLPWREAGGYLVAQLAGGILGV